MTDQSATPVAAMPTPMKRLVQRTAHWLWSIVWFVFRGLTVIWCALAVYYSNLPWPWARSVLAIGVLAFGIWALWLARRPIWIATFAALFIAVLIWYFSIQPSHDREWRPEVAIMPRAEIDGDRIRITGYRNFLFRSVDDFTPRYEDREYLLSHLTSLDFYISYWMTGPVGHTFVSFNFDNAPPLCISIETRPEADESYDPIASMFRQFELIYVVGDERDIVRVRTNHRDEQVFLYRLNTSPEAARRLLLVYLERINELADRAEWYHLLSNSCTINIVRYANLAGRVGRWDFRHLLNGLADRYLYSAGALDTTIPFAELRRMSLINDASKSVSDDALADEYEFSMRIREGLPNPRAALQD